MIKEKDRIKLCKEKYGLTEEEATRIVKADNCLLNIDELRVKYDYPDLGRKYPDWLSPIEHYKMCCATVRQMYNNNFERICTPEEMASILYIKSSIKLNTLKNHKHLKAALVTMSMGICRDGMRRQKYWNNKSLDDTVVEDGIPMYETIVSKDNEREEQECLNAVKSIKNREVRELLIIAGFIIGRIGYFEKEFMDIVNNSKYVDKTKLIELLEQVVKNDELDMKRASNIKVKERKIKITMKSVLEAYKTDLDTISARQEIGYYLMSTGFLPA